MDEILKLIESLDIATTRYADIMMIIRMLEEKISMYDNAAKKLKIKKAEIKETVRLRMIDEGLEKTDTEFGNMTPQSSDCLTMANFDLFLNWLREGVVLDIKKAAYDEGFDTPIQFTLERYGSSVKANDRLSYLKQACFNSEKLKEMHEDPEDTLPPGIGIFQKEDLSITKATKKKKGAKKT